MDIFLDEIKLLFIVKQNMPECICLQPMFWIFPALCYHTLSAKFTMYSGLLLAIRSTFHLDFDLDHNYRI